VAKIPLIKTRKGFLRLVNFLDVIPKMTKFSERLFRIKEVGNLELVGELVKDPLSRKFYRKDFLVSVLKMKAEDFITKKVLYPFIMLASTEDKFIPFEYEKAIYEKINAVYKDFLPLNLPSETHIPLHEYPDEVSALLIPKFEKLFKS
jgi:hypothetical protein